MTRKKMMLAIETIAKETLRIDHLKERKSDSLDFHDRAVWTLEAALIQAYEAGESAAKNKKQKSH